MTHRRWDDPVTVSFTAPRWLLEFLEQVLFLRLNQTEGREEATIRLQTYLRRRFEKGSAMPSLWAMVAMAFFFGALSAVARTFLGWGWLSDTLFATGAAMLGAAVYRYVLERGDY